MNNDGYSSCYDTNTFYHLSRVIEKSRGIVNTINSTQQGASPSPESIKYRIITELNNNEDRIGMQLIEGNYTSNLNSSAESGRLEICLGFEKKPRYNNKMQYDGNTVTSDI